MAGCDQDERLPQYRPSPTILGGAVHETRNGRDQDEKSGDEGGGRAARRVVRHAVRKVQRLLRLSQTSVQVRFPQFQ